MSQEECGIIHFPDGLLGFPDLKDYQLLEPPDGYPFKFLQAVARPEVSFTCMDAAAVKMDYEVPLSDADAAALGLEKPEDALVLTITVVPEDPKRITADLAGPVVINTKTRVGRQIVLDTRTYPLRHHILATEEDVVLDFPSGLIGFPDAHSFRLLEPEGGYPLKFLQAVEAPDLSFSCIDVAAIQPDYAVPLGPEDAQALALEKPEEAMVLALVVIPDDPRLMTANLAGPLVVNTRLKTARQVVLNTEEYPLKYRILPEA